MDNYNIKSFFREEMGIQGPYSIITNAQKNTINTADSFCFSPFGMVSNIDCPEWDPACNCVFSQFRPEESEPTEAELVQLRKEFNECALIQKEFPDKDTNNIFLWSGVDYSNPHSSYNCPACNDYNNPESSQSRLANIKHFKPTNQPLSLYSFQSTNKLEPINVNYTEVDPAYNSGELSVLYPYSPALSGICFGMVGICLSNQTKKATPYDNTVPFKMVGDCFPFYLEYSKTNATFWNTPQEAPLLRQAQMSLLSYNRIKFIANGNYNLKPGNLVYIDYKTGESAGVSKKRYDGYWMVYKVERILTGKKHSMAVYLMRDGSSSDSATIPNTEKKGE